MRQGSFFEGVPATELESVLAGAELRLLPKGSLIVSEGDFLVEMYVILSGTADVAVMNGGRRREIVAHIQPGETIGEMSLLTHAPASADVLAHDELEVLVLNEHDLDEVIEQLPQIQRNIISILSARIVHMNKRTSRHRGRVVVIERPGRPTRDDTQLAGAGLAASIAWHTHASTLYLAIAEHERPVLARLATISGDPPFRPTSRLGADFIVVRPDGAFAGDNIVSTLEDLTAAFAHVVIEHDAGSRFPVAAGQVLNLRLEDLPVLGPEHENALKQGLLAPTGDVGKTLGRIARQAAGLRVGVALGSGSVRGYAHVGALRALEQLGVPIDCVAGTSIGAIVGGLYCHFKDTDQVAAYLDEFGSRLFRPTLSRKSLLSTRALRRYTEKVIGDHMLEDLDIPLAAVATDVDTCEEVVYRRGSAVTALLASTAIPGVFPAVRVGGRTLVDGGIVNPVPTTAAAELGADVVIAVRLVSGGSTVQDAIAERGAGPLPSAIASILRSVELVQTRIPSRSGAGPTLIITPQFEDVPAAKLRHFSDGRRYIPLGEDAVRASLPRLQSALPWLRTA